MTSMPMPMEKGPLHTQESLTDAFAACGFHTAISTMFLRRP